MTFPSVFDLFPLSAELDDSDNIDDDVWYPHEDVVKCKFCGHPNLVWTATPHGPRLTYASGPLIGKIHECEIER